MPLFHRRCHGARTAYEKMNRYAVRSPRWLDGTFPALLFEMVWWNISGATISHVLRINCVSMARGWRTFGAYGVWMAMPLRTMSHMRTWPLGIHGASGVRMQSVHPTYTRRSTRFYGVWRAYVQCMGCVHAEHITAPHYIYELWMWISNVQLHSYVSNYPVSFAIWYGIYIYHRNDKVLITGRMIG